jgi:hypothetical protein
VSWSVNFQPNADPLYFYPDLDLTELQKKNNSVDPVPNLDLLINNVIDEINREGQKINPDFVVSLATVKSTIPSDYNTLSYKQRYNTVVNFGRNQLTKQRNQSVAKTDFKKFYEKYYFYTPTDEQIKAIQDSYRAQDYGFGATVQETTKQSALNRSIQYGLLPDTTTLLEFEVFTDPANKQNLIDRLTQLNGTGSKAIISPDKIASNPTEAAFALMQLTEENKLSLNNKGTYEWTSGNNWKELQKFNNGNLLNGYQSLLVQYENSDAPKKGVSLSQYIAQENKDVYKEIEKTVSTSRLKLNPDQESVNQAQAIVESSVKDALQQRLALSQSEQAAQKTKIDALRLDAFREAKRVLDVQEQKEARNEEIFGTMNDMFDSISKELGVKEGFFKPPGFQSNINFNWQNWFETELRNRYSVDSNKNVIGNLIGTGEEEARLGAQFIQDFLQRRFDASKSLSEFVDYIDPSSFNPVLEERTDSAMQKLNKQGFEELTGDIEDKNSVLGNFWTNMQSLWQKGRTFDVNYYLNQSLGKVNNKDLTVNQLQRNMSLINDVALQKNTLYLDPSEIKNLKLVGIDTTSDQALQTQIDLYQNWFYKAYENGVDISNPTQFAKLHYDSYIKNSTDPALSIQPGTQLLINNPNLLTESETKQINEQVKFLTEEADKYFEDIQFGKFKTPEEYLSEMLKKSGIIDTENGDLFKDAGLTDVVRQYIDQFSGAISNYAGEVIRDQIRNILDTGKMPNQKELGIDYIQRTKDQALATIRSLISKDVFGNKVVIDNAPGMALNESMSSWFSELGLSLVPGTAWEEFKKSKNLSPDLSFSEWEESEGKKTDPETGLQNQKVFWDFWGSKNNVDIIETLDPNERNKTRLTVVVREPSASWVAWAKRISTTDPKNEKLEGAQVNIRSDAFNTDWYSKTNPYTKIKDDWNRIVGNSNQTVINTKGKNLSDWAKENGLNPEEAWVQYRTEQQKQNSKFGKDVTGNNLSYITWIQNASEYEVDKFWKNSNQFWFKYLEDKGVIKGGDEKDPEFKTWNEWSTENNVELKRVSTLDKEAPPDRFLELHYYALGGSKKVNEEYIKTYFPEFSQLENSGILGRSELSKSQFDLTDFGFNEEDTNLKTSFSISSNRSFQSPIDFAMQQMFGDSLSQESGDPFADISAPQKPLNDFGLNINLDTSYNKNRKKSTDLMNFDFGFGDLGGNAFGF